MRNTKTMAVVVVILLVLCGVWFLPSVAGQGSENSMPERVRMLEEIVAELSLTVEELNKRVDELEEGSCTCKVLNLQPLPDRPSDPDDGDLCVVDLPPTSEPGAHYGPTLSVYLNGRWFLMGPMNPDPIVRP
jgi:hypothetical protein